MNEFPKPQSFATPAAPPDTTAADGLPHLAGPAAAVRQALAAHFLRGSAHVLEIGGHINPITGYLTHAPLSVTSIDPKTPAYESDTLNGRPCRVRHIARKFQDVEIDLSPFGYGLVMLGLSLKPYGQRPAVGERLGALVDKAGVVVIEHALDLERATTQLPELVNRSSLTMHCSIDLGLHDAAIAGSPYARRRLAVYHPAT